MPCVVGITAGVERELVPVDLVKDLRCRVICVVNEAIGEFSFREEKANIF